jgi:hypothetical protein
MPYEISLGEKRVIKTPKGNISAGMCCGACLVKMMDTGRHGFLFSRFWSTVYLYPDCDMTAEPLPVGEGFGGAHAIAAADWNHDGVEDLIVTDRNGFLFLFEQVMTDDGPRFVRRETVCDAVNGLPVNLEYLHPIQGTIDAEGGYTSPAFFNYLYPAVYPDDEGRIDLIVGDLAGRVWWIPDLTDGKSKPQYAGRAYRKRDDLINADYSRQLVSRYGMDYSTATEYILDEEGREFVVGDFYENGTSYPGGIVKPIVVRNPKTGRHDLLLAGGTKTYSMHYLRCVAMRGRKPVFRDLGEVAPDLGFAMAVMSSHTTHVYDSASRALHVAGTNVVNRFDLRWDGNDVPRFENRRKLTAQNIPAGGYLYELLLKDPDTGRLYVTDFPNHYSMRELLRGAEISIRSGDEIVDIQSQRGPVRPLGETDPQGGPDWGFHRSDFWDFDASHRSHIILGTDRGELYLLIDEGGVFTRGRFRMEGPLRDSLGNVIKIHNRAKGCGFDLDGDGREDLVVCGQTYQMGMDTDPRPGCGFYAYLNKGLDDAGLPILKPHPLLIEGHAFRQNVNRHLSMMALDIDHDGKKEIILASQVEDGFRGRIMKKVPDKVAIYDTGSFISDMSIVYGYLDIDGDGEYEAVYGGNETGISYYCKLVRKEIGQEENRSR